MYCQNLSGAGYDFATQPGGIGQTEYYRRIAMGFPSLTANQIAYEMDTYDITPEDVINAFRAFNVPISSYDVLDAYERGGGRKFLSAGEQERYAAEAAAAAQADAEAADAAERIRLAAEAANAEAARAAQEAAQAAAEQAAQQAAQQAAAQAAAAATKAAQDAAAAATKAAQDAAAAAAKVAADAAAATAAADAARAKAQLDLKYSFLDPSIESKTAIEKAQYFNYLKSTGRTESEIFEAIAYWIGPQSPESIAELKTLADDLLKPKVPDVIERPTPSPLPDLIQPQQPGGNTGLLIAAGLAALTLLG